MPSRPFLLTETQGVEPSWLEDWPLGGVALVVGGSVDMRMVRTHVKEAGFGGSIQEIHHYTNFAESIGTLFISSNSQFSKVYIT